MRKMCVCEREKEREREVKEIETQKESCSGLRGKETL